MTAAVDVVIAGPPPPEDPPPKRSTLRRTLLFVIELVVVAGIAWALYRRRQDLSAALDLDVVDVVVVFLLCAAAAPLRAIELTAVTRSLGVQMSFIESLALTQAATLLNFLPMQAGTLLRARVLKTQRSLSYARYVAVMSCLVLFAMAASSVVGLVMLPSAVSLPPDARTVAGVAFVVVVVGTAIFLGLPLGRLPLGGHWVWLRLRDLIGGWQLIKADRRALLVLFSTALATPLLLGLRYWVCFHALSQPINVAEAVLFASAVLVSIPFNVTPGGIGVRELVGSAVGAAAGLGFAEVLAAVTIDRVISLVFSLVAGSGSLAWLKRRKMV